MTPLLERCAALVAAAGYTDDDAVVVGVQRDAGRPVLVARGRTADGRTIDAATRVYVASLAKQVVAVCAALLVRQGRLDLASPLTDRVPELPAWARDVRVRHLLSHTAGLPSAPGWEELVRAGTDHTTAGVLAALAASAGPRSAPGTEHRYSNEGYVCLALVVARAAGRPFGEVARELVLEPLGLRSSGFWDGPGPHPPGAAPIGPAHPAPLSLGDGGLWSTAADLLRWNLAMDRDELGVATLVQTPGRLDDGTPLDYAWGVGVREHAGRTVYRHGGRWAGVCAQLVRLAGQGSSLVVLALDDEADRANALADSLLTVLAS